VTSQQRRIDVTVTRHVALRAGSHPQREKVRARYHGNRARGAVAAANALLTAHETA